jgi:fatty-acid desaturase
LPAIAGYLVSGALAGAATGLWGGLVRVFFVHHVTWSVNSVCHFLGNQRFDTDDRSTNVLLALQLGLAHNVVRISPERQAERAA